MTKLSSFITILFVLFYLPLRAQTIDTKALAEFPASTIRQTFEICRHVKLSPDQQIKIAKAIEKENARFLEITGKNDGLLTVKGRNQLAKMRDNALAEILDTEQLEQYYRGIYNAEADAEGNAVANTLQKRYGLTDQNWKFIRVAFYKLALESRVIKKTMADQPKKAAARIAKIKEEQMKAIEEKGGLRVNPDMTITWLREFRPNELRR